MNLSNILIYSSKDILRNSIIFSVITEQSEDSLDELHESCMNYSDGRYEKLGNI